MQDRGTVHQAMEDNEVHQRSGMEARQGAISGRVITVLVVSTVGLGVIYAFIWLWNFI